MVKNNFYISLALLGLFLLIGIFLSLQSHEKLQDIQEQVKKTQREAETFASLKRTWDQKSSSKKLLKHIQAIAVAKVTRKGDLTKLYFDDLSQLQLDKLMQELYKKPFKINKLHVSNRSDKISTLSVEIIK